jgi:hypothetical protein
VSSIHEALACDEVAAIVCCTLEQHGIRVVLCGGAVVSIYSENDYESYDLDFVPLGLARKVDAAMEEMGFRRRERHWAHPKTRYWVEFPSGPVQVGNAVVRQFAERSTAEGVLRLLPPTECVMDRLAGYFHWNDPQCLDQALAVARRNPVDLARIEAWSRSEGGEAVEKLRDFLDRLRGDAQ